MPGPPAPSIGIYRLHLALASLLLVLLAWHRHATVAMETGARFEDPDALFHAHRAEGAIAARSLLPPAFDRFENFPDGGRALWPPLHDATLALLARFGGSTADDPARGMLVAAAFPVMELVAALFAASALARGVSGTRGGILSAWLFATTPCLPRRGAFGEIDHNITEVLGALLLASLAAALLRRAGSPRFTLLAPFAWGGAVLLALGFYTGLVLGAAFAAAGTTVAEVLRERGSPRVLPSMALGFALAALVLPLFAGLRGHLDLGDPWRLGPVYVLILSAGAIGTGLVALALGLREGFAPRRDAAALAAVVLGLILVVTAPAEAFAGVIRGFGFLGSRDPWLATIDEFRPLFSSRAGPLAALPALAVGLLTLALFATRRKARPQWIALAPLAVPFLLYTLLAVAQKRLLPPAAAFGAAAAGAAWGAVRARPLFRWAALTAAAAALFVASSSFLLPYLSATFRGEPAPSFTAGEEIAAVLAHATPDPGNPPAWGVLAPWDYGHQILQLGRRAVALNNFGSMQPGFARATRLFLETSPAKAADALDRLRLRYLVAAWPPNVIPTAAQSLGVDASAYFLGGWSPDRITPYAPTSLGERTLLVRLHLRAGSPLPDDSAEDRRALARFREVWTSPQTGPGPNGVELPFMRLFELGP